MKTFIKYAVSGAIVASLSACSNVPSGVDPGSVIESGKFGTLDAQCFYSTTRPAAPNLDPSNPNMKWHTKQLVAFKYLPNGRLIRMRPNKRLQDNLDAAASVAEWISLLNGAAANNFVPYLSNVPGVPSNTAVESVANRLSTPARPRLPDPVDLELDWFSTLAFVIVENERPGAHPRGTIKFDDLFPPFVVLDGGRISPFYDPVRESDKLVWVNYVSIPPGSDAHVEKISKRDCIYEYVLNTVNTFTSNPGNVQMQSRFVIDPGGEGSGDDPPPPQPPGWP